MQFSSTNWHSGVTTCFAETIGKKGMDCKNGKQPGFSTIATTLPIYWTALMSTIMERELLQDIIQGWKQSVLKFKIWTVAPKDCKMFSTEWQDISKQVLDTPSP